MGEGNEKKVARGARMSIQAQTWNSIIDAVKSHKANRWRTGPPGPLTNAITPATTIELENTVSDFAEAYHVLEIGTPLIEAEDDPVNLAERIGFQGWSPTGDKPIAIMAGACASGDIGRAVIAGVTPAYVKMLATDHQWANAVAGEDKFLESSLEVGAARILWHDETGLLGDPWSGTQIALVQLGGGGGGGGAAVEVPQCLEWYTEYHHLGYVAVSVGDVIEARAVLGTIGTPTSGAHSHFSLGDGSDFLNTTNYAVVGQSLDIDDWLPWPTEGTHAVVDPVLYDPPVFVTDAMQETARAYIRSVFVPWLPVEGYKNVRGSTEHKGGDWYAVDVFPDDDEVDMAGTTVTLAIGSGAVENTVIFAGEINGDVKSMVIVRHRVGCCPHPWKGVVRCATTESADINTAYVVGATVDGVTLALGDFILVKDQTSGYENRIGQVCTMGPPMYRWDADSAAELVGATVRVQEGTVNRDSIWSRVAGGTSWQVVWQTGFFARLTSESGGLWKFVRLKSTAGAEGDDTAWPESPTYCAAPITYDGVNYFADPVADMQVWMHWGRTEFEFFPIAPTPNFEIGCGLAVVDNTLVVDLTENVADGVYFDAETCTLGIDWGCGLYYTGTQLAVNMEDVAGDRASTALVAVANDDPVCDSAAVDLEWVTSESYPSDERTGFMIVGGKLRETFNRRIITIYWNAAGLQIDTTIGSPVAMSNEVPICDVTDCCEADELTAECTKSNSGGAAPWEVDFTCTPAGGVAGYTYEWNFGDGEFAEDSGVTSEVTHEYTVPGTYTASVDVYDDCGNTVECVVSGTITITEAPIEPGADCETAANVPFELDTFYDAAPGTPQWWKVGPLTNSICYDINYWSNDCVTPLIWSAWYGSDDTGCDGFVTSIEDVTTCQQYVCTGDGEYLYIRVYNDASGVPQNYKFNVTIGTLGVTCSPPTCP